METVRKKIYIGKYLNREYNSALFYPYVDTPEESLIPEAEPITPNENVMNYKEFCCDVVDQDGVLWRYLDAFEAYASVRTQLQTAIFLVKIGENETLPNCAGNDVLVGNSRQNWYKVVGNFLSCGEGCRPFEIICNTGMSYVSKDEIVADVEGTYIYTGTDSVGGSLVALDVKPDKDYLDMYRRMADGSVYADTAYTVQAPSLTIPVLLTDDYTKNGLLRIVGCDSDENVGTKLTRGINATSIENDSPQLESKLSLLISDDVVCDEETGEYRNYVFVSGLTFFKINKTNETGSTDVLPADNNVPGDVDTYWSVSGINDPNSAVTNGVWGAMNQSDKYVIATTKESAMSLMKYADPQCSEDDWCNFLILYNGVDIPYSRNNYFNIKENEGVESGFTADAIIGIDETSYTDSADTSITETEITFTYVIGGSFIQGEETAEYVGGGVIYTEVYKLVPDIDYIKLDGCPHVPVYYKRIDYSQATVTVYNPWLGLTRETVVTNDISFNRGSVMFLASECPVVSDDKYAGLAFMPKVTADIEFNRGNATAFERHFKLSECNTVADVEQYGNNSYFKSE